MSRKDFRMPGHSVCVRCARSRLHMTTTGKAVLRGGTCALCNGRNMMMVHVLAVDESLLYVPEPELPPNPLVEACRKWLAGFIWGKEDHETINEAIDGALRAAFCAGWAARDEHQGTLEGKPHDEA